ncbi:hypothetical protein BZZ01_03840 [Nostocales cyanobacterium HT-58-2]|nr:hypothetical protein BZZ01_03840 [Nostocales cyanobacterium HT-58-2]
MNKMSFGFGGGSSTPSEGEVIKLQLQQKKPDSDTQDLAEAFSIVVNFPNECEVDAKKESTKTVSELQFEQLLSNLLKYGVIIASTVVLIGGILYLLHHGTEPADYQFFQGEPSHFRSPTGVVRAVLSGSRRGIIQLGLLLLVATPIIRVVISLFIFLRQREFTYVVITLTVLTALIYSLVGAYF